mgnify:CR=1 FL=1
MSSCWTHARPQQSCMLGRRNNELVYCGCVYLRVSLVFSVSVLWLRVSSFPASALLIHSPPIRPAVRYVRKPLKRHRLFNAHGAGTYIHSPHHSQCTQGADSHVRHSQCRHNSSRAGREGVASVGCTIVNQLCKKRIRRYTSQTDEYGNTIQVSVSE